MGVAIKFITILWAERAVVLTRGRGTLDLVNRFSFIMDHSDLDR